MEMCIDNPREGFANVFDTHPSVDDRVAALVKFAGGHDPGPLAIEPPQEEAARRDRAAGRWPLGEPAPQAGTQQGPWGPEPAPNPADEGPMGPETTLNPRREGNDGCPGLT